LSPSKGDKVCVLLFWSTTAGGAVILVGFNAEGFGVGLIPGTAAEGFFNTEEGLLLGAAVDASTTDPGVKDALVESARTALPTGAVVL
jgi:hypothetical protein